MSERTRLREIDHEIWRFILYESPNKDWIAEFYYSPISFVDLSLLIQLDDIEKAKAIENRNSLLDLSDRIRNDYKVYLRRSLDRKDFVFI